MRGNRDNRTRRVTALRPAFCLPAIGWSPPICLRRRHQAATKDKDSRLAKHQTCWPLSLVDDDATKDPFDTHKHDKSWSMQHIHLGRIVVDCIQERRSLGFHCSSLGFAPLFEYLQSCNTFHGLNDLLSFCASRQIPQSSPQRKPHDFAEIIRGGLMIEEGTTTPGIEHNQLLWAMQTRDVALGTSALSVVELLPRLQPVHQIWPPFRASQVLTSPRNIGSRREEFISVA